MQLYDKTNKNLLIDDKLTGGLLEFGKKFITVDLECKEALAKKLGQFLNHGSPNDTTIPPEKDEYLKGSLTVFVGEKFVWTDPNFPKKEYANISSSGETNRDIITAGYNTPYSARMHEHQGAWGEKSLAAGDVGNRWMTKHFAADGEWLVHYYGQLLKEKLGM